MRHDARLSAQSEASRRAPNGIRGASQTNKRTSPPLINDTPWFDGRSKTRLPANLQMAY